MLRFRGELHRLRVAPAPGGRSTVARIVTPEGFERRIGLTPRDADRIDRVLDGWLRDQARLAIDATVADHAAALDVRPAAISLRDPKSRWGSASRQGRLMFSWRLVLAPPEALETVVIHELAHLRVFGHGPRSGPWSRRAGQTISSGGAGCGPIRWSCTALFVRRRCSRSPPVAEPPGA